MWATKNCRGTHPTTRESHLRTRFKNTLLGGSRLRQSKSRHFGFSPIDMWSHMHVFAMERPLRPCRRFDTEASQRGHPGVLHVLDLPGSNFYLRNALNQFIESKHRIAVFSAAASTIDCAFE